jgi:methylaspartate ammonia-lyase
MLGRLLAERQKQLQRSGGVDALVVDEICDHYETALSLLQDVSAPQRFLLGGSM